MDLSLHSFILVIGLLVMAYIAFDGIKKIRAARQERINFQPMKSAAQSQDYFSAELPNGGARVVAKHTQSRVEKPQPLSIDDELLDELPDYPAAAANVVDTDGFADDDDFFSQPVDTKPAFINPVIVEKPVVVEKPNVSVKPAVPKNPENELLKSVIRQTEALKAAVSKPEVKEIKRTEPVFSADTVDMNADAFSSRDIHDDVFIADDKLSLAAEKPVITQEKPITPREASVKPVLPATPTMPSKPLTNYVKPSVKPLAVDVSEAVPMLMDSVKLGDGIVDQFVPKQQEIDWDAELGESTTGFAVDDLTPGETPPVIETVPEAIDSAFAVSPEGELLSQRAPAEEVIVIHVLAHHGEVFDGAKLKHIFKACDLRFGEMDIFHRFEKANASGKIQFSIASAVKPGTFNLHDMDEMETPGLSFFMSLPGPEKALEAFDTLHQVAQVVAKNLGGELHDETHSDLTPQTLEHYRQRIADFTRKRRLNKTLK